MEVGTVLGWVGLFIGVVSCAFAVWAYYAGGESLKKEAAELRRLNYIMLRAMNDAGLADVGFDEYGNITGLRVALRATIAGTSSITAKLAVARVGEGEPPPDSTQS